MLVPGDCIACYNGMVDRYCIREAVLPPSLSVASYHCHMHVINTLVTNILDLLISLICSFYGGCYLSYGNVMERVSEAKERFPKDRWYLRYYCVGLDGNGSSFSFVIGCSMMRVPSSYFMLVHGDYLVCYNGMVHRYCFAKQIRPPVLAWHHTIVIYMLSTPLLPTCGTCSYHII